MEEKYIGYIKYEGELVGDGLMDARRQAKSLLAFDSALRYFIAKQAPDFRNLDFEIPVRIRKGSWEALIPETVAGWVQAGLGVVATAYFTKAAQKMAEKDFADFGITDLFRTAIDSIKWFARIGKHMVYHSVSLVTVSVFPTFLGLTGLLYLGGALLLGTLLLAATASAALEMTVPRARRVFLGSLLYQPLLLGLMLADTVRY